MQFIYSLALSGQTHIQKTFLDTNACIEDTQRDKTHTHTCTCTEMTLKYYIHCVRTEAIRCWVKRKKWAILAFLAAVLRCMFGLLSFILLLAYACYLSLFPTVRPICMCIGMNVLTFMMSFAILFVHENRTVMGRSAIDGVWSFNLFKLRKAPSVVK